MDQTNKRIKPMKRSIRTIQIIVVVLMLVISATVFAEDMKNQFVRFVRASTDLIQFYHSIYPVLNCDVWIENAMIHQWLALLEFHPEFGYEQNGQQIVRAVRYCSEDETELSSGQRPVVH